MKTKDIIIKSQSGFDSKTTAVFIKKASSFASNIYIEKGERKANGKSLLGLLSLGHEIGSKITITTEGQDEEKALFELGDYLNNLWGNV
jgi:phosphocarrier protein HPr